MFHSINDFNNSTDETGYYDDYHNLNPDSCVTHTQSSIDLNYTSNVDNIHHQFQNKYNLEKYSLRSFLNSNPTNYRRVDTMFRFYRISNSLNIKNPDRIYKMFLTRLRNRKRLESSPISLELVVAALFYIDQRNNSSNNYTLRDVLSRIPSCNIGLKAFSSIVSKVSREAGISKLSMVYDNSIISNMLEQLRTYCLKKIEHYNEKLAPDCTTTVLLNMKEFNDLDAMIKPCIQNIDTLDNKDNLISDPLPKTLNHDKLRYNLIYKLLFYNYNIIERISINILNLLGLGCSEDILDPTNRIVFRCKKTLLSVVIFTVLSAMRIPVTTILICKALDVSKSTFYRNYRNLVSRLSSIFKIDEKSKIHKRDALLRRILALDYGNNGNRLTFDNISYKNQDCNDVYNIDSNKTLIDEVGFDSCVQNSKLTFNKSLRCLDVYKVDLHISSDFTKSSRYPVYYDKSSKKYICFYKDDGKTRKRSFSTKLYGLEGAFNLAMKFSTSI